MAGEIVTQNPVAKRISPDPLSHELQRGVHRLHRENDDWSDGCEELK